MKAPMMIEIWDQRERAWAVLEDGFRTQKETREALKEMRAPLMPTADARLRISDSSEPRMFLYC